jgi:hypothetical protein
MLLLVSAVKLVLEVALMVLLGQFVLGLLAGAGRDRNIFYRLLQTAGQPFVRATRFIAPRVVLDRHVPVAAFFLLAGLWLFIAIVKVQVCVQVGMEACR